MAVFPTAPPGDPVAMVDINVCFVEEPTVTVAALELLLEVGLAAVAGDCNDCGLIP